MEGIHVIDYLASLAQKICTLYSFSSLVHSLLPKDNLFKNI